MKYFHVGIIVEDLESAMGELGRALELSWHEPHERSYDGSTIRVCFSKEGPPYLELIEGQPGSHWSTDSGPHLDHLGYWSSDFQADVERLEAAGMSLDIDGVKMGGRFNYHRSPSAGLRIELIDANRPPSSPGGWRPDPGG